MMIHMINVFAAVSMFARMLVTFRHNLNFVIVNLDVGNEGCLWYPDLQNVLLIPNY